MEGHEAFNCPITQQIMKDPVVDSEGNTYERAAIIDWLTNHNDSPITRNPLHIEDLKPNRALRDSIEEYLKAQNQPQAPQQVPQQVPQPIPAYKAKNPVPSVNDIALDVSSKNGYTMVSIKPPDSVTRIPCDLCCVVDISGSMGDEAALKDGTGKSEGFGLSKLDVVKHAIKTIIDNLQVCDRLSIVAFSSQARIVFELIKMNDEGHKKATVALEALAHGGQTNLWDGLANGLEVLRKGSAAGRISSIFLLTDGMPNVIPPRGHVAMIQKYKDDNKYLPCTINTFGFGYQLDSKDLSSIAIEGNGSFAFIPDSSMIGTIFVNAISNFMTNMAINVILTLEPRNGTTFTEIPGGHQSQATSWGTVIHLGSINYGQSKDIVFKMAISQEYQGAPNLTATLKYEDQNKNPIEIANEYTYNNDNELALEKQYYRLVTVDTVRDAINEMNEKKDKSAKDIIKKLIKTIKSSEVKDDGFIVDLLKDLGDQIMEAFSREDYYNKWGKHYLPSLIGAHLHQVCNNFKDVSVQHYGGKLFAQLRDKADETFCKLPPPKPSIKSVNGVKPKPVASMARYNNASSGCFHGDCSVLMANGTMKSAKEIRKNDLVMTPNGNSAKVSCVLKINCIRNKTQLVEIRGGLLITPWHPVRIDNIWQFPCYLGTTTERNCTAVYNFVLETKHIMIINGIECVTLGHHFEGEVVQHSYFGTNRVIYDLQKLDGWTLGFIELTKHTIIRDPKNGLICGMLDIKNQNFVAPKVK